MSGLVRKMHWPKDENPDQELLLTREWLLTNGLGGYAAGTISGVATRRYHSYLNAALPSPLGRMVMFNHLAESLQLPDGTVCPIGSEEFEDRLHIPAASHLEEFKLDMGLPVWRYRIDDLVIEKQIVMSHMQNTVYIYYRLIEGDGPVRLELHPSFHFRHHEEPVNSGSDIHYTLTANNDLYEVVPDNGLPPLRMKLYNEKPALTIEGGSTREIFYRMESNRGYESKGQVWSPGYFRAYIYKSKNAVLVASTEAWETVVALQPEEALQAEYERRYKLLQMAGQERLKDPLEAELVIAADQYIITPAGRVEDSARARASGDEVRSIIAGYHWFTDWGRDTMISLEGLTLSTKRFDEARWILKTFAHYVKDGLIPNMFPEGKKDGLYHTADATLWFFHALDKYIEYTNDRLTFKQILPVLIEIVEQHIHGTRFGIGIDKSDGLLRQGQEGYQLTWMDAKVDDWVVTPRRGKAVEINALWFNALSLLRNWVAEEKGEKEASKYDNYIKKSHENFNKKFWFEEGGYLYDVIEGETGNDDAFRPNQVFAISLKHPVLEKDKWEQVLQQVKDKLLTPVGLRSLAQSHPDYKPKYFGNLRSRDAAYHQGTVWGWLIGPFVDAWLKVHLQEMEQVQGFLDGFNEHLDEACIGSISEVFDAEAPFTARGCVAQAWSVAEVLRCRLKVKSLKVDGVMV